MSVFVVGLQRLVHVCSTGSWSPSSGQSTGQQAGGYTTNIQATAPFGVSSWNLPPVQDATGRSEVVRTLEVTENRSSVLVNILSENCQLMYFDYIIYINYHEFDV